MKHALAIFIGGGFGSLVRFGISNLIFDRFKSIFPIATLLSNILSCIILSIAVTIIAAKTDINTTWKFLIITGFCGGFSTFSAFSYETSELIRSGNSAYAVANILISVLVCVGIVYFITKSQVAQ